MKTIPREDVKRVRKRLRELNRTQKEIYDQHNEDKRSLSLREFQEAVGQLVFWAIVFGFVLSCIILLDDFLIPLLGTIKEWMIS